jgi:hypothetical protein
VLVQQMALLLVVVQRAAALPRARPVQVLQAAHQHKGPVQVLSGVGGLSAACVLAVLRFG